MILNDCVQGREVEVLIALEAFPKVTGYTKLAAGQNLIGSNRCDSIVALNHQGQCEFKAEMAISSSQRANKNLDNNRPAEHFNIGLGF